LRGEEASQEIVVERKLRKRRKISYSASSFERLCSLLFFLEVSVSESHTAAPV
jgi:hypothetical protein